MLSAASSAAPTAIARARTLVRAHRGDLAAANLVYALSAGRAALDELLEDSAVGGGPGSLAALGWFGHLDAVPYLSGRLASDDDSIRDSAANALQRITGLVDPAEGEHLAFRLPTAAPSVERGLWQQWWTSVGQHLDRTVRYRHGAPWSATTNLVELRAATSGLHVRGRCLLELRSRVALRTDVDLRGFVANQLTSLTALEHELRTTELPQSGWPVTIRV